jgi:hypothetical protein
MDKPVPVNLISGFSIRHCQALLVLTMLPLCLCANPFVPDRILTRLPNPPSGSYPSSALQTRQGFGLGAASCLIFSGAIDQKLLPGFNVASSWQNNEWLIELRGKFFFGEMDVYQFETAGYRPLTIRQPYLFLGGGLGYGGMNRKELMVYNINGLPVQGLFYHNGNGLHAFLGLSWAVKQSAHFSLNADLDYFLSFYNIDNVRMPSGIRCALSVILHAPE